LWDRNEDEIGEKSCKNSQTVRQMSTQDACTYLLLSLALITVADVVVDLRKWKKTYLEHPPQTWQD
jgi:hypothetical protein